MTLTKKPQVHFLHRMQKYTHLNIPKGDLEVLFVFVVVVINNNIGGPLPSILDISLTRCSSKPSSIVKDRLMVV